LTKIGKKYAHKMLMILTAQAVEQGNLAAVELFLQDGAPLDTLDKNDRYEC
jgi:hypothetical protein